MEAFFVLLSFAAGFVGCWFAKDWLIMSWDGTSNFVRRLEAKAKAIRDTL